AAPMPLPTPSMTAPLSTAAPAHTFDAGPLGTIAVTGILSGIGSVQNNRTPADKSSMWDVDNAQVFVQKTTGWWQFYFQGGAYNIPDLGLPYLSTNNSLRFLWGPLPVGYMKFVKGGFSAEVGELPTLIGAEYTFDFENTNIERGLLWNQENAVNRGIQLNYTKGPVAVAFSWNDGFYSNRYNWLSGVVTYTFDPANVLSFVGMGNLGHTGKSTLATPLAQNNSEIYNVIYTHTVGSWTLQPYVQYTNVPSNSQIGITKSASTIGGAMFANYAFNPTYSLGGR